MSCCMLHVILSFSDLCLLIGLDDTLVGKWVVGDSRKIYNGMSINPGEKVSKIM